jgi:subfamily B ATP-binding cassette protein MsbA
MMLIGQAARLFLPFSAKYLIDVVVFKHQVYKLPWLVAGAFVASTLDSVTFFFVSLKLTLVAETLISDLRKRVQVHLTHLPLTYFDSNLTGTLVSRVMWDVEGLRHLVGAGMLRFCLALLTTLMTFFVLVQKSWEITLIVVGVLCLAAIGLRRAVSFIRPLLGEGSKLRAEVTGRFAETVGGVRIVKGYCAEDHEAEVFAHGVKRIFINSIQFWTWFSAVGVMGTLTVGITTSLAMLFGGRKLLAGNWTTGDYFQYTAMLAYLIGPVFQLVDVGTQFTQAVAGLDRIIEVLSEPWEDSDSSRTTWLPTINGEVRFENVSFAYGPERPVLHEVSFVARPGTVSALVGASGSGKSTIISLLCGFHKPNTGRVLVDGADLSSVTLSSYRSQLGMVLQESFLFDGTIRENILFSRSNISEERFMEACRIACVDEFARQFPDSYGTIVGERGVKLSGGQRQRLSIARAILSNPRILLLDEATSSLDSESEANIREGMTYLMEGRTTFIVAHRLSTIRRADQILVLEGGRILEHGTHESLCERGGRYCELYTKQSGMGSSFVSRPDS